MHIPRERERERERRSERDRETERQRYRDKERERDITECNHFFALHFHLLSTLTLCPYLATSPCLSQWLTLERFRLRCAHRLSLQVSGYCDVPINIEGKMRSMRFTRPQEHTLILSAPVPPVYDADIQGPMDRLRQLLRRLLSFSEVCFPSG